MTALEWVVFTSSRTARLELTKVLGAGKNWKSFQFGLEGNRRIERYTVGLTFGLTPVAGLIFETKNRAIFLERFFWRDFSGEKLLPVQLCSH